MVNKVLYRPQIRPCSPICLQPREPIEESELRSGHLAGAAPYFAQYCHRCLRFADSSIVFTIAESSETTSNEGYLPSPIVPYEDFEFRLPASTMGAYSTAAVSTDTRPCAKVGT